MKVYCDANVLIEVVEGLGAPAEQLNKIFLAAESKSITLATSALSLAETLQKPLQQRDSKLVSAYAILLSNERAELIKTIDVDRSVLVEAAFVRLRKGSLKLPDAIHIATAERTECSQFLSRDQRLVGATVIPVIDLGPDTLGRLLEFSE